MMLQAFRWDARFELGIAEVDAQHRRLVDMLNTLIEVVTEQRHASEDDINALLDGLEGYAQQHFSEEEALMARSQCDSRHIVAHTRQHEIFADQIRVARREYLNAGRSHDILELLAGFVTSWLSFHILGSDREMAGQIARVRAGQPAERRTHPESEHEVGATRILIEAMGRLYELMAERNLALADTRDQLSELNASLEQRVVERTAELRKALEDVDRTRGQLLQSEKMAAIGQLAAGVAHEINNPVGFVSSNLGTLNQYVERLLNLVQAYEERAAALPEHVRADIAVIRKQLDFDYLREDVGELLRESAEGLGRVKKIVQDMKEFSHVDKGDWAEENLNAVLESTLNVVWHEIKYKAEVVRQLDPELPLVHCQASQISQVLMNLLVNAAQAIEQPPGKLTLVSRPGPAGIELIIEDNGKGMSADVQNRLFEPFFTTKPVGKGTGLGLSLSYEIVKRHGGRIEVDSEEGRGSRFIVHLPLAPDDDGEVSAPH